MGDDNRDGYVRKGERFLSGVFTLRSDSDGQFLIIHHGDAYGETISHVSVKGTLRDILSLRGLDICTKAERKVLDCWAQAPEVYLRGLAQYKDVLPDWLLDLGTAELARRQENPDA